MGAGASAFFLRSGHYNMMIDVGGSYDESKFSIGQQILRPLLAVHGIKQLDSGGFKSFRPRP